MVQETQARALYHSRGVGWGGRWERGFGGRHMGVPMAESCRCLTENNKIL